MKVKIKSYLIGLLVLTIGHAYANIYSWTGDDGVLYFSDKPGSPDAKIYIEVDPQAADPQTQSEQTSIAPSEDDALAGELAAANVKLNQALSQIETLTGQVENAESKATSAAAEATAAAEAAAGSAEYAADTAESADDAKQNNRVVYYRTPYYSKHDHKQRLHKRHLRDNRHEDAKNRFRYGQGKHGSAERGKHRVGRSGHKHKVAKQHRQGRAFKRHSSNFVNGKFKRIYRRPTPSSSTSRSNRNFIRSSRASTYSEGR